MALYFLEFNLEFNPFNLNFTMFLTWFKLTVTFMVPEGVGGGGSGILYGGEFLRKEKKLRKSQL